MSEYIIVRNLKSKKHYRLAAFDSYVIDQSIDVPADYFSFSMGNYKGQITDIISVGDELNFYIDDKLVLNGLIDDLDLTRDGTSNSLTISGRDKISILLDNDALPTTYYNMTIAQYLKAVCPQYGINNIYVSTNKIIDKIAIGAGKSEFSILEDICKIEGLYPRYDVDTLKCTYLRRDRLSDYKITNDTYINPNVILIKSYSIKLTSDIKTHVHVYSGSYKRGKDYSSSGNIKGEAADNSIGFIKRRIIHERDLENNTDANKMAKEELKSTNRSAFTIIIETHTKIPIFINRVAYIKIDEIGLECHMLINKVTYSKNNSSGSTAKIELKLMEDVPVEWKNHNIPKIPR